ncbi:MAG: cytochrome P450 [Chitinophagales bacterium]|nr:cytochrome P450 [Chitinophagales bacterium]
MNTASPKLPPGPKHNLLLSREENIRNDILGYFHKSVRKYNGISRARLGPFYYVSVSNPAYIEHIFLNRDIYVKGRDNRNLKFLLGNGLLTNEGEFWLKQRRLMQPLFHKQRLQGFVTKIEACTNAMLNSWRGKENTATDLHSEMTKVTLEIVSQTLMSTKVQGNFKLLSDALHIVMEGMLKRTRSFLRLPYWLPLPHYLRMKRARKMLDSTIYNIIEGRRKSSEKFNDLLTMLMEVEDADTAERMTDTQLRDEVITIYLAGHETTANALAFTFYLLAKHPEIKQRIDAEVQTVLNQKEFTYDLLQRLEFTTNVIKESMRLFPPAWGVLREAAADDVIDGYLIKKGDSIVLSPYAVQRMEKYWDEPLKFDPDRFLPERIKHVHKYAYFPFGGGQRLCIGNNFAMMEMQIIVALACKHFNFTLAGNFALELEPLITLRPKHGVPVMLHTK